MTKLIVYRAAAGCLLTLIISLVSVGCSTAYRGPDHGFAVMGALMDPLGVHARASRNPFDEALKESDLKSIDRQIKKDPYLAQHGLLHAVVNQRSAMVEFFFSRGAVVTIPPPSSIGSWIQAACYSESPSTNRLQILELLLAKGAAWDVPDSAGVTPLMIAIERRHEDIAERLLGLGVAVNAMDREGRTALHRAVTDHMAHQHQRVTKTIALLIHHGANPQLKDKRGRSPLDLVEKRPHGWSVGLQDQVLTKFRAVTVP